MGTVYNEQGSLAVIAGQHGEQMIVEHARKNRIQVMDFNAYDDYLPSRNKVVLVRQYPFIGFYGRKCRVDFALVNHGEPVIAWEVKHQDVPGSVDEKLPYVYLNLISGPWKKCGIIMSGKYWQYGRGEMAVMKLNEWANSQRAVSKSEFSVLTHNTFNDILTETLKEIV